MPPSHPMGYFLLKFLQFFMIPFNAQPILCIGKFNPILTAWEFKKPFFVKMKISPGWLKQNIF
jgi:hypothetical protein